MPFIMFLCCLCDVILRWDQEALRLGRTGLNFPANGKPSNHGVSTGSKDGGGRGSATINDGIDDEHHDDGR
jgi:hypothetical protein